MKNKMHKFMKREEERTTVPVEREARSANGGAVHTVSRKRLAGFAALFICLLMLVSAAFSVFLINNNTNSSLGSAESGNSAPAVSAGYDEDGNWTDEEPVVVANRRSYSSTTGNGVYYRTFSQASALSDGAPKTLTAGSTWTMNDWNNTAIHAWILTAGTLVSVDVEVPAYTRYNIDLTLSVYSYTSSANSAGSFTKYQRIYSMGTDPSIFGSGINFYTHTNSPAAYCIAAHSASSAYTLSSTATYTFDNPTNSPKVVQRYFVLMGGRQNNGIKAADRVVTYIRYNSATATRLIPTTIETEFNAQKQSLQEVYKDIVGYPTDAITNTAYSYVGNLSNDCINPGTYKTTVTIPNTEDYSNYVFYEPNYTDKLALPQEAVIADPGTVITKDIEEPVLDEEGNPTYDENGDPITQTVAHNVLTYEITIVIRPARLDVIKLEWDYDPEYPERFDYQEHQMKLVDGCYPSWLIPVYEGKGTNANITDGYDTTVSFVPDMDYIKTMLGSSYSDSTWTEYFKVPELPAQDAEFVNGETFYCDENTPYDYYHLNWLLAPMQLLVEWEDNVFTYGKNSDTSTIPFLNKVTSKDGIGVREWDDDDFSKLLTCDFLVYEFYDNANCAATANSRAYTLKELIEDRTQLVIDPQTYWVKVYLNPEVAATSNFVLTHDDSYSYKYSERATYEYYETPLANYCKKDFTLNADTDSYAYRWTQAILESLDLAQQGAADNTVTFTLDHGNWDATQYGTTTVWYFSGYLATASAAYYRAHGYDWQSAANYGALWVPDGAKIVFDLNGNKLDRHLTAGIANGTVILTCGELTIKDSKATGQYDLKVEKDANGIVTSGEFITPDMSLDPDTGAVLSGGVITGGYNSSANLGGGITVYTNGTLNFESGIVYGNYESNCSTSGMTSAGINVVDSTGTLNVTGGAVVGNHATYAGSYYTAGGIGVWFGKVSIKDCFIALNESRATNAPAGGINIMYASSAALENLQVLYNVGGAGGIGMWFSNAASAPTVKLSNLTVKGNTNYSYPLAGGIYVNASSYTTVEFENCTITENMLVAKSGYAQSGYYNRAGGVWINVAPGATFTNCEITKNNTYYGVGGMILTNAGTVEMKGCKVDGNTTTSAPYSSGWVAGGMNVDRTKLTMTDGTDAEGNVIHSSISNNTTATGYGAIFFWGTSASTTTEATLENVKIEGNSSLYECFYPYYFAYVTFTGDKDADGANISTFSNNTVTYSTGRGMYAAGSTAANGGSLTLCNVDILENRTGASLIAAWTYSQISIKDCNVSSNVVTTAGYPIVEFAANTARAATIEGTTFSENDTNAGYVINANSSPLTLTNCTFEKNGLGDTATKSMVYSTNQLTVDKCTFTNNKGTAGDSASGSCITATGTLTLTNSEFSKNSNGSATVRAGAGAELTNLTFSGNEALYSGGIYAAGAVALSGTNTFIGNGCTDSSGAGAIYQLNGSLDISDKLTVTANYGGYAAVYLASGTAATNTVSTFSMEGAITISGNVNADTAEESASEQSGNLYIPSTSLLIDITGSLAGSQIYVGSPRMGAITNGYTAHSNPTNLYTNSDGKRYTAYFIGDGKKYETYIENGEVYMDYISNSSHWTAAVQKSVALFNQGLPNDVNFELFEDWVAVNGYFNETSLFAATYANGYTTNGGLYVPAGASIILNLNGYKIDRAMTAGIALGGVIRVGGASTLTKATAGKLVINDSTQEYATDESGSPVFDENGNPVPKAAYYDDQGNFVRTSKGGITGGWEATAYGTNTAAAVYAEENATLIINSGNYYGNKDLNTHNSYSHAIIYATKNSHFEMHGGTITDNTANVQTYGIVLRADGSTVDPMTTVIENVVIANNTVSFSTVYMGDNITVNAANADWVVKNCLITNNTVTGSASGGAGGIDITGGVFDLQDLTITNNSRTGVSGYATTVHQYPVAGGISVTSTASSAVEHGGSIKNVLVNGNECSGGAGGITIDVYSLNGAGDRAGMGMEVELDNVTVTNNISTRYAYGIYGAAGVTACHYYAKAGYGVYGPTVTMSNCTVSGNHGENGTCIGGGVTAEYCRSFTIKDSTIEDNVADAFPGFDSVAIYEKLEFDNVDVIGNTWTDAAYSGSYMNLQATEIVVKNTNIQQNTSNYAGVWVSSANTVTFENVDISENKVTQNASGYAAGLNVTGNANANVTLTDVTIDNNESVSSFGGVCLYVAVNFTMNGGSISGNTARYYAGMYAGASNLELNDVKVDNNEATTSTNTVLGIGITQTNGGKLVMNGGSISGNRYIGDGTNGGFTAGIYSPATASIPDMEDDTLYPVRLYGVTISNNETGKGTNIVAVNVVSAFLRDCEISSNGQNSDNRWVVYATGNLRLYGCVVKNNKADVVPSINDGAIIECYSGGLSLSGCEISGNTGGLYGAVYVRWALNVCENTKIINNTSTGYVGGMYIASGTADLVKCTISNNEATGANAKAGGLYTTVGTSLHGCTISGNICEGAAAKAGGIYTTSSLYLYKYSDNTGVYQSTVSGNYCSGVDAGAGIYVYANGKLYLFDGTNVTNNMAPTSNCATMSAGGIYVCNTGSLSLEGQINVSGNTATIADVNGNPALGSKSDVYMVNPATMILVTDSLSGSNIGIYRLDIGFFTSGYGEHNTAPAEDIFFSDSVYSEVTTKLNGTYNEGFMNSYDNERNWSYAVQTSLNLYAAGQNNQVTFTLYGDWTAKYNTTYTTSFGTGTGYYNGMLYVPQNANIILELNGHKIDRDISTYSSATRSNGGVMWVQGTLTMQDSGRVAYHAPINSATLQDGEYGALTGGMESAGGWSGGVLVYNTAKTATFMMLSGVIEGNTGTSSGGVQANDKGVFEMYGGEIRNNTNVRTSISGGAVDVYPTGKFIMQGGSITGNISTYSGAAGAVSVQGGGVMQFGGGSLNLPMGVITIDDNYLQGSDGNKTENNIYTATDYQIIVKDKLADGTKIGITRRTMSMFTTGYGTYHADSSTLGYIHPSFDQGGYFFSDDDDYMVIYNKVTSSDGTVTFEAMIGGYDNKNNWTYAVQTSLSNNGATSTFYMYSDWDAETHSTYTTAFGTNTSSYINGALYVPVGASVILDLRHHRLDRHLVSARENGYVIYVAGELIIVDNDPEDGTANPEGGVITGGNTQTAYTAAGITIAAGGTVRFEAGTISDNLATYTDNTAGAVYVYGSADTHFTMTGGTITDNQGYVAGGVFVDNGRKAGESGGTFTMTGGEISGNVAKSANTGGVRINSTGILELSGTPVINNNSNASYTNTSNLYLVDTLGLIEIADDGLKSGADIHITRPTIGTFTHNYGKVMGNVDPNSFFTSDNADYYVTTTGADDTLEAYMACSLISVNWSYAVQSSIDKGGAPVTFTLTGDWTASSDISFTTSFGSGVGYNQGRLYLPGSATKYATIILDLNGYSIDRGLFDPANGVDTPVDNGSVFFIEGTLIVTDSVGGGSITGGNSETGGIYNKGELDIMAGSITGNKSTSDVNGGGILNNGTLRMSGGKVTGNYGTHAGVYNEDGGEVYVEGSAYIYDNFTSVGSNVQSNLYLKNTTGVINVSDELDNTAKIGFVREGLGVVTKGYGRNNTGADPFAAPTFVSDSTVYELGTTGTGIALEVTITSEDPVINWTYAVKTSLANGGAVQTFTLYADWIADADDDYTTSFGDDVGYLNGGLYVPEGASIIIDLKGHSISRDLSNAIDNGYVLTVGGTLSITDSAASGDSNGKITGGNSTNTAGGIEILSGASVTLENGCISDNSTSSKTKGAGVTANGKFTALGGIVSDNTTGGDAICGGVYVPENGMIEIGGSAQIQDNDNSQIYFESETGKLYVVSEFTRPGTTISFMRSEIGYFTEGYGPLDPNGYVTFVSEDPIYIISSRTNENGIKEGFLITKDNQKNWEWAVKTSLANGGATEPFQLSEDWNAENGIFGTDPQAYINGALYVPVGASIDFDLNGFALNRGLQNPTANGYVMYISGDLTLNDMSDKQLGVITGGNSSTTLYSTGGVYVNRNATFTMYGGNISNNKASGAGGGGVFNNGTFVMDGGNIGSFVVGDVSYDGNSSLAGGVYNGTYGDFTMKRGTINGNTGSNVGGLFVYNGYGSVTMEGGSITNNSATSAGGIYVSGEMTMTGGTISGNESTGTNASSGGGSGVYIASTGEFTMLGGIVTKNIGFNGIRAYSSATLNMGGSAQVVENKDPAVFEAQDTLGEYRNVYLTVSTQRIHVVSEFNSDALIGVTRELASVFTYDYGTYNFGLPSDYFFSDITGYGVASVTEQRNGLSIVEVVIGQPTGKPAAVTPTPEYDGNPHSLLTGYDEDTMEYVKLPDGVTYKDGEFFAVNAGLYEISFKPLDGYCWSDGTSGTIYVTCTLSPRVVELEWSNLDLVYNGKSQVPTAMVTNKVGNDVVDVTVSGAQIDAGTYEATAAWVNNTNYTVVNATHAKEYFTIHEADIDPEIVTETAPYNTPTEIEISGNIGNGTVTYTVVSATDGDGNSVAASTLIDMSKLSDGILLPSVSSGSITLKADVAATKNTNAGSTPDKVITFTKADAPLDLETKEVIYGDTLSLVVTGNEGSVSIAIKNVQGEAILNGTNLEATKAGLVDVILTMDETANYNKTVVTVSVKINPRPIVINWDQDTLSFVYDGWSHIPSASIDESSLVPADIGNVSLSITGGQVKAGTWTATVIKITDANKNINNNYTLEGVPGVTQEFEITKAPLNASNLKLKQDWVVYGDQLVLEVDGNLENADVKYQIVPAQVPFNPAADGKIIIDYDEETGDPIYTPTAIFDPTDCGKIAIQVTVLESANYSGGQFVAVVEVKKAEIEIELETTEVVYGDSIALVISGNIENGAITYTIVSGTQNIQITNNTLLGMNAGQALVYIEVADTSHYTVKPIYSLITVKQRPIAVVWNFGQYTYNGQVQNPIPSIDPSCIPSVFPNDDVSITTVQGAVNAGTNTAKVLGLGGADAANYTIEGGTLTEVNFEIDPRPVQIRWGATSLPFTGEEQAPSCTVISGLIGNDVCDIVIDGKQIHVTPAGSVYTATAVKTTNSNYTIDGITNASVNFTIYKVTPNPTIVNDTVYYYQNTQIEVSGNIGGGVIHYAIIGGTATCTIDPLTGIVYATTYGTVVVEINIDATDDTNASNYVSKTLTVVRGEAQLQLEKTEVYYGDDLDIVVLGADPQSTVTVSLEVRPTDTGNAKYDSATGILTGTKAGTVTIVVHTTGTVKMDETTKEFTVTVLPRPLQVNYTDSFEYDGESHVLTIDSIENLLDGDTWKVFYGDEAVTGNATVKILITGAETDIGDYNAIVKLIGDGNYCLHFTKVDPKDPETVLFDSYIYAETENDEEGDAEEVDEDANKVPFAITKKNLNTDKETGLKLSPMEFYIDETPVLEIIGNDDNGAVTRFDVYDLTGQASFDPSTYKVTPYKEGTLKVIISIEETEHQEAVKDMEFILTIKLHEREFDLAKKELAYGDSLTLSLVDGAGNAVTEGTADGEEQVTYTIVSGGTGNATINGNVITGTKAGTVIVHISVAARDVMDSYDADITVNVKPRVVILEWTENANGYTYNGTEQAPTAAVSNKYLSADDVTVKVKGQVKAGDNLIATAFELDGADQDNYTLVGAKTTYTFNIDRYVVHFAWDDEDEFVYDGEEHVREAHVTSQLFVNAITGTLDVCEVVVKGAMINAGDDYVATVYRASNNNYALCTDECCEQESLFTIIKATPVLGLVTEEVPFGVDSKLVISGNIGKAVVTYQIIPESSISQSELTQILGANGVYGGGTIKNDVITPSDLGWVKVEFSVPDTNNTFAATGTGWVQIVKGKLPFDLVDKSVIYGDTIQIALDLTDVLKPGTAAINSVTLGTGTGALVATANQYEYEATKAGTFTVIVTVGECENYNETQKTFTITIERREVTIEEWDDDSSFVYNGKEQYPGVKDFSNVLQKDLTGFEFIISGNKNVGTNYTAKATGVKDTNYVLANTNLTSGTYEITPFHVTLTWGDTVLPFTGKEQAPDVTINTLFPGDENVTAIITGKGIDVGNYTAKVTGLSSSNYVLDDSAVLTCDFTIVVSTPDIKVVVTPGSSLYYHQKVTLSVDGNIGGGNVTYYVTWIDSASGNTVSYTADLVYTSNTTATLVLPDTGTFVIDAIVDPTKNTNQASGTTTISVGKANRSVSLQSSTIVYGTTTPLVFSGLEEGIAGQNYSIAKSMDAIWNGGYLLYDKVVYPYNHLNWSISYSNESANMFVQGVGTYRISLSVSATEHYNSYWGIFYLNVVRKPITIEWNKSEFVYNGNRQVPTVNLIGIIPQDAGYIGNYSGVEYTMVEGDGVSAGTHTVTVTRLGDLAYANNKVTAWPNRYYYDRRNGNLYYQISGTNLSYTYQIGKAEAKLVITTTKAALGTPLQLEVSGNYGNGEVTYQILGGGSGSATLNGSILNPTALGIIYVRASVPETANYNAAMSEITAIEIGKAYAPIGIEVLETIYGDNLLLQITDNLENAEILMSLTDGTGSAYLNGNILVPTAAGTVTLTIMTTETATYQPTTITKTIVIKPRPVEIEWDEDTLVFDFDGNVHAPTANIVSGLVNGDESGVNVTGGQINKGKYTATAASPTNPNYTLNTSAGNLKIPFEILGVEPEISLVNKIAYIGENLLLTISGNVGGATPTYTIENGDGWAELQGRDVLVPKQVGDVFVTITVPATANTTAVTVVETVTIMVRPLEIKLVSDEVIYGDSLELDITGNLGGGAVSYSVTDVDGRATLKDNVLTGTKAGEVRVTVTVEATVNYGKTVTTFVVTVKPRPVSIIWDTSAELIYNGTEQAPTASVSKASLIGNDTCTVEEIRGAIDAGDQIAEVIRLGNSNYTVEGGTNLETVFTIKALTAVLEWDTSEVFIYDGTEKKPTATVANMVQRDIDANLNIPVIVSGEVHSNAKRDNQQAVATANLINNNNYSLIGCTTLTCLFDIEQLEAQLDWNTEAPYNSQWNLSTWFKDPDLCSVDNLKISEGTLDECDVWVGLPNTSSPTTGISLFAARANASVGSTVTLEAKDLSNADYKLGNDGRYSDVEVVRSGLTIEWNTLILEYNGEHQIPVLTLNGLEDGDEDYVEIVFDNISCIDAGKYTIYPRLDGSRASYYTLDSNYTQITFEIVPKPVEVVVQTIDSTMIFDANFSNKIAIKTWSDWFKISCSDLVNADQTKPITDIFDPASIFAAPIFYKLNDDGSYADVDSEGNPVSTRPNALGKYEIQLEFILPMELTCKTGNYTVEVVTSDEYGVLTVIGDGTVLKIDSDSEYRFLYLDKEDNSTMYRKNYEELGWTHGEQDASFDRVVLGFVYLETTASEFVLNIDASQRTKIRIYGSDGTLLYDCGNTIDDNTYVGTGSYVELLSDGVVIDKAYISVLGDTNGDGQLSVFDAANITSYFATGTPEALDLDEYMMAALVINSGSLSVFEAATVNQAFAGYIDIRDYL